MKIKIEKEWCLRMAEIEGDAEIGAGPLAVDPVFPGESVPAMSDDENEQSAERSQLIDTIKVDS